jgi:hypothetical protein
LLFLTRSREAHLLFGNDNKPVVEPVCVLRQQIPQYRYLVCTPLVIQTEQNNTAMQIPLPVDFLAKVLVVRNQDPTLVVRAADHLFVGDAGQLVEYRTCIVDGQATLLQPARYIRL